MKSLHLVGMKYLVRILSFALFLFNTTVVQAQGVQTTESLTGLSKAGLSMQVTLWAVGIVALLIVLSILINKPTQIVKQLLFWSMTLVVVATTFFLAGLTIYVNQTSWSKGPVHWHADFEVWACGTEYTLKDPTGFSNKIGTAELHEHNDSRIHYEGVVVKEEDAYLQNFFRVTGGSLTAESVTIDSTAGKKTFTSGTQCSDGNTGFLQMFAIKSNPDKTYSQISIPDPAKYLMSHHSQVPPGDCIIIEFGSIMERTDKLCQSYEVAKETGKLTHEVDALPSVIEGDDL